MPLHRLTGITMGVPDLAAVRAYYREWGLGEDTDGGLSTLEGGRQLVLKHADRRRLLGLELGADDPDDLRRISSRLAALSLESRLDGDVLTAREPVSGMEVTVSVAPREEKSVLDPIGYNHRGTVERVDKRAPVMDREGPVRPRKLGHLHLGSRDVTATQRFFIEGLGFKASDYIEDKLTFMRCSTDHHNIVVQQAPVDFLHHTAWEVDDVDEVGRGAMAMLAEHPERHVWGLGRHHIGSNFFWYLRDPAGNFSEYYSDLDCIVEDHLWDAEVFNGGRGALSWGPPPPPSMIQPEDLASLMAGTHASG
ncbi:VOC family protein [Streptomyces sp. B1866]|uniref:VOC family protein n=1 Tax=Streptomyces sp. B1866 TaxID=3075431 RepID=UPI0028920881|nr:VOC family protein [Streptomyces sp. B1866]MDT3395515.1 VOC family protein [Streptomyces sp. B1866]